MTDFRPIRILLVLVTLCASLSSHATAPLTAQRKGTDR